MPRSEHWMPSRNKARLKWDCSLHEQTANRFRNPQRSHSCDTVTAILRSADMRMLDFFIFSEHKRYRVVVRVMGGKAVRLRRAVRAVFNLIVMLLFTTLDAEQVRPSLEGTYTYFTY